MPRRYAEARERVFHNSAAPREYCRMKKTKILVAGGGFAGCMLARNSRYPIAQKMPEDSQVLPRKPSRSSRNSKSAISNLINERNTYAIR
jgi:hypothetical protein